jgi:hypothetical protein
MHGNILWLIRDDLQASPEYISDFAALKESMRSRVGTRLARLGGCYWWVNDGGLYSVGWSNDTTTVEVLGLLTPFLPRIGRYDNSGVFPRPT